MTIKDIQLTFDRNTAVLSAQCKIRKIGWDRVYFSFEADKYDYVYADASPFVAALLLPAMKRGENLVVHGQLSAQLYAGMQDIMAEVSKWGIGCKSIRIKADKLTNDTHKPRRTATFFSGGVDSFYTYLKHKNDRARSHRVDTFILINNNFDIDPRNKKLWTLTVKNIRNIARAEHVDLVIVESNINSHELLAPIVSWDYIHGSCLAATGLALRRAFKRIYIPSTHSAAEQIPWGSSLALDKHWSTEATTFVHDGSETTRLNKVITQIARSPVALKYLRVCYKNLSGTYNCGKCDKCMRTMVNLYIAGALEKARTFPHRLDAKLIAATPTILGKDGGIFHTENLIALREKNLAPELQRALAASMERAKNLKESRLAAWRDQIISLDHTYAHGYARAALSELLGKKYAP